MVDFNEYFILIIEGDDVLRERLDDISEIPLNCLEDGDISLCTIVSSLTIDEIKDVLRHHIGASYFIFDMNSNDALRYKIDNVDYEKHLFSELKNFREDSVNNASEDSMDMVNHILDKGGKNLTQKDYDLLNRLTDENNKNKSDDG